MKKPLMRFVLGETPIRTMRYGDGQQHGNEDCNGDGHGDGVYQRELDEPYWDVADRMDNEWGFPYEYRWR